MHNKSRIFLHSLIIDPFLLLTYAVYISAGNTKLPWLHWKYDNT